MFLIILEKMKNGVIRDKAESRQREKKDTLNNKQCSIRISIYLGENEYMSCT